MVLGRGAGALDERDRDLVHAGRHVHGNLREPLHDLGARRRTAAVHEVEILAAAELRAEHLVAVEQHDGRVLALERAGIEPDVEVRDRDAVFAVGQEVVREAHAAARAERHAVDVVVLIVRRRGEGDARDLRHRFADGDMCDMARGADVLLEECR